MTVLYYVHLFWTIWFILASMFGSLSTGKDYYRAAVLEHVRFVNVSFLSKEIVERNLKTYEIAANTAAFHGADIIVFPEWALHPHDKQNRSSLQDFVEDVPDPKHDFWNPCNERELFNDRPILKQLSCFAKNNNIFVVANMIDKKKCQVDEACDASDIEPCNETRCPADGLLLHNTNVVFDREGTLTARYYKRHLYFEFDLNPPLYPEHVYFETDFGNFTTFICFDMSFKESVEAIKNDRVVNVAYPTYWYDHVPFFLATPFQQSWSLTNNVNLLAANVHNPGTGTLGSGIYSGTKGALVYSHYPNGHSKLLISNVPKVPSKEISIPLAPKRFIIKDDAIEIFDDEGKNFTNICSLNILGEAKDVWADYRCMPTNVTGYEFVKLNKSEDKINLCSNKFCCSLSYKADFINEDYYFGVSGNDFVFYDTFSFGVNACFLSRCESFNGFPCTNYLMQSHTVFNHVELSGTFSTKYVYPFVMNSGVRLASTDEWSFNKNSIIYEAMTENSLLFLGLYGRFYDRDTVFKK